MSKSKKEAGYRAVIALRFAAPDSEFRTAMLRTCHVLVQRSTTRAAMVLRYAREALAQALDGTNIDTVLRTLDALADQAIK